MQRTRENSDVFNTLEKYIWYSPQKSKHPLCTSLLAFNWFIINKYKNQKHLVLISIIILCKFKCLFDHINALNIFNIIKYISIFRLQKYLQF